MQNRKEVVEIVKYDRKYDIVGTATILINLTEKYYYDIAQIGDIIRYGQKLIQIRNLLNWSIPRHLTICFKSTHIRNL